ncbi:hypothetical protein MOJ79_03680 [Calidifontimicrobium sp. SYSU G02091]|uniref:hypothetical protein n=1 Tax=Calidifontimicrobium sp. SYSU G02091 TaxID=2926421 RepID=UPI001F53E01F|nr:hypothetical protein [Calidifontimicrobium sp. SYSU G02091]MCI1190935.1 hypothetical protein [Calidifontimicrobium sp. SYSU G02091]
MKTTRAHAVLKVAATLAVVFGLATIVSGTRVLLGGDAARAAAGAVVPFVLWFNTTAGLAYVVAGIGLWRRRRWSVTLAVVIAAATVGVFAAFGVHALGGGAYEVRTVGAMALRTLVWMAIAAVAWRLVGRGP